MRYRRFLPVEIVVVLWVILRSTAPCVLMFNKTSLNRLARASNIKMLDHQTMFGDVFGRQTLPVWPGLESVSEMKIFISLLLLVTWVINGLKIKQIYKYIESLPKVFSFFFKCRHCLPKKSHSKLKLGCFELQKTRNLFFFFFLNKICRVIFTFCHLPQVCDFFRILLTYFVVLLRWWTRKNNCWRIENHSDFEKVLWTPIFFRISCRPW